MEQIDLRTHIDSDAADQWPTESQVLVGLLAGRFSCRGYRPDPVPRPTIERMLQTAQLSASWCNSQPWQVIVTEGQGTERFRQALSARAAADATSEAAGGDQPFGTDFPFPAAYRGVYRERKREVGWQLYGSVGVTQGDRVGSTVQALKNFTLFDAPHALIITSERDLGVYGAIDCGLYTQALLLAAESLGLGMIPQAALASYPQLVREDFQLPENRVVVLGCSFGFADPDHPANGFRSRRAQAGDVVSWVTE